MAPPRERNDRPWSPRPPAGGKAGGKGRPPHRASRGAPVDQGWIWGWHAVSAALQNPARESLQRLVVTEERADELERLVGGERLRKAEVGESGDITRLLPQGAAHQGAALLAPPLEGASLPELAEAGGGPILMLDQVTDPQNVGAIFRSAAAFGASGVVLQDRHAPALAGALAKAAAGAIERVPHARVVNLSRALDELADLGWRAVGLAGEAEQTLEEVLDERPTVLVLGSEGEGLRRLVSEHCDALGRIPMPGGFESLNVSNAAAVALYETARRRR